MTPKAIITLKILLVYHFIIGLSFQQSKTFCVGPTRRSNNTLYRGEGIPKSEPFDVLRQMKPGAENAFEDIELIVFLPLGISLTGIHDDDLDGKAISLSTTGEWEANICDLSPINFLGNIDDAGCSRCTDDWQLVARTTEALRFHKGRA